MSKYTPPETTIESHGPEQLDGSARRYIELKVRSLNLLLGCVEHARSQAGDSTDGVTKSNHLTFEQIENTIAAELTAATEAHDKTLANLYKDVRNHLSGEISLLSCDEGQGDLDYTPQQQQECLSGLIVDMYDVIDGPEGMAPFETILAEVSKQTIKEEMEAILAGKGHSEIVIVSMPRNPDPNESLPNFTLNLSTIKE